jgi:hypothetical protein
MSVWKPTPHTQHHKLNLQVALLTVANGSSTVTILTQTTIQLAQAYCKTPTSAGFHSGATTVTSGVHCAKKNPTDTPNNYKGNQLMKTTTNQATKISNINWIYNGIIITYRKSVNSRRMFFYNIDGIEHRALSLELAIEEINKGTNQ